MKTAIIIFAHGSSKAPSANAAVRTVAEITAQTGDYELVEAAFLEPARPNLEDAVTRLVDQGASRILVVPYFLTPGIHLLQDLPEIVERLSRSHGNVEIRVTAPLDGHPGLARIVLDRVRDGLTQWER